MFWKTKKKHLLDLGIWAAAFGLFYLFWLTLFLGTAKGEIHCAEECMNLIPETGNVMCHQVCYDDLIPPQNNWYSVKKTPIPTVNPTVIATHTEVAEMLKDFLNKE